MGAFYNSICLPGDRRTAVRDALDRWLGSRGFVRSSDPPLFDLDPSRERSVFVLGDADWTVLCFSDHEEERRLIHELGSVVSALLYVWVWDSTTWGYDVFRERAFGGSFSSDPREHLPFHDAALGAAERPRADPVAVANLFGRDDAGIQIAALQQQRAVFKEDVCRSFCQALGMAPAMASYEELECGSVAVDPGWNVERLHYQRAAGPPATPPDLRRQRVTHLSPTVGVLETGTIEVPREVLDEMHRLRRRQRVTLALLRPISWLARTWRSSLEMTNRTSHAAKMASRAPDRRRPAFRVDRTDLVNDRHGCRISLPAGARSVGASNKPSAAFAFAVAGVHVSCTARRRESLREVLRRPDGAEVEGDELFDIAGLPARHLVFRLPAGFRADIKGTSLLGLFVVQAAKALYVFVYRSPRLDPIAETQIRVVVESFRLLPDSPAAG